MNALQLCPWQFSHRCYSWGAMSENRSKIGDFAPTRSLWSRRSASRSLDDTVLIAKLCEVYTKGWTCWVGLGGWLHTELNVSHRELNPDTVTHTSTNRYRRGLTSLIENNVPPYARRLYTISCIRVRIPKRWVSADTTDRWFSHMPWAVTYVLH